MKNLESIIMIKASSAKKRLMKPLQNRRAGDEGGHDSVRNGSKFLVTALVVLAVLGVAAAGVATYNGTMPGLKTTLDKLKALQITP